MVSVGQEFMSSSAGWSWCGISDQVSQSWVGWGCSLIWRLDGGWMIHFDGPLSWLGSWWWLLAGGLSSSPPGPNETFFIQPQSTILNPFLLCSYIFKCVIRKNMVVLIAICQSFGITNWTNREQVHVLEVGMNYSDLLSGMKDVPPAVGHLTATTLNY